MLASCKSLKIVLRGAVTHNIMEVTLFEQPKCAYYNFWAIWFGINIYRHYSNLQHEPVYEFQFLEMIFAFIVYSEPWRAGESAVITGSMATFSDKQSFPWILFLVNRWPQKAFQAIAFQDSQPTKIVASMLLAIWQMDNENHLLATWKLAPWRKVCKKLWIFIILGTIFQI